MVSESWTFGRRLWSEPAPVAQKPSQHEDHTESESLWEHCWAHLCSLLYSYAVTGNQTGYQNKSALNIRHSCAFVQVEQRNLTPASCNSNNGKDDKHCMDCQDIDDEMNRCKRDHKPEYHWSVGDHCIRPLSAFASACIGDAIQVHSGIAVFVARPGERNTAFFARAGHVPASFRRRSI